MIRERSLSTLNPTLLRGRRRRTWPWSRWSPGEWVAAIFALLFLVGMAGLLISAAGCAGPVVRSRTLAYAGPGAYALVLTVQGPHLHDAQGLLAQDAEQHADRLACHGPVTLAGAHEETRLRPGKQGGDEDGDGTQEVITTIRGTLTCRPRKEGKPGKRDRRRRRNRTLRVELRVLVVSGERSWRRVALERQAAVRAAEERASQAEARVATLQEARDAELARARTLADERNRWQERAENAEAHHQWTTCARCGKHRLAPWRDADGYICVGCLAKDRDEARAEASRLRAVINAESRAALAPPLPNGNAPPLGEPAVKPRFSPGERVHVKNTDVTGPVTSIWQPPPGHYFAFHGETMYRVRGDVDAWRREGLLEPVSDGKEGA